MENQLLVCFESWKKTFKVQQFVFKNNRKLAVSNGAIA